MNTLVAGGTGYLGSYIAEELARCGHTVTVLARGSKTGSTSETRLRELKSQGITAVYADLSKPGDLRARVDAAPYDVIVQGVCSFLEPTTSESLTLRAMEEVIAFAAGCQNLKQIIDLGNCLVLADAGRNAVPDEESLCIPNTLHGHNKLKAERMLRESGLPWIILRIGQVYGGKGASFDWVVLDGIRKGTLPLPCLGSNRVGLVHVEDVAQATRLVIEQGHRNLILNVSSDDVDVTQGKVFDLVADSFGVKRPMRIPRPFALMYAWFVEQRARLQGKEPEFIPDMVRALSGNWVLSIEKAKRVLGYQPKYPKTLEGIRMAYADVFTGKTEPFVPAGRLSDVRGVGPQQ
ncbi:MAG: NAD-dependent epimerase/dehydratase family protein [Anaerolineales bacterium]